MFPGEWDLENEECEMKSTIIVGVVIGCLFTATAFGAPNTEIWYGASYLGPGLESGERWQYTYDVTNKIDSLIPEIKEFTIWFDYGKYNKLTVTTPDIPTGWDHQIVWDPEPVLKDAGAYDAKNLGLGIGINTTVQDFVVTFDWLGGGTPGKQFYEIIDPDDDYKTIESGWTVPEPATLLLLGAGSLVCLRTKKTMAAKKRGELK